MGFKFLFPLILLAVSAPATIVDDSVLDLEKQFCRDFKELHLHSSELLNELWKPPCQSKCEEISHIKKNIMLTELLSDKKATKGQLDFLKRMLEFDRLLREYYFDAQKNGKEYIKLPI